MLTLIAYGGGAVLVVAALYALGVFVLPKGEQLAPAFPDAPPWALDEDRSLTAEDVIAVRLPVALRGYRFGETDVLLDRLAEELAARDRDLEKLRAAVGQVPAPVSGPSPKVSLAKPEDDVDEPDAN